MPADLFVSELLQERPARHVDHRLQLAVLHDLASKLADEPEGLLSRFVELSIELTGASSGGISLLEPDPAPGLFRWHHLQGKLAAFDGATTPRNHSPCGVTLDERSVILCQHPERHYEWLVEAGVVLDEVLLVPLTIGPEPVGTLWVVADQTGHFCQADSDVLAAIASHVSSALKVIERERSLRQDLQEQHLLAREMSHRLKNLFSVTNAIVGLSARSARSPAELAESLSGRLRSLADAHSYAINPAGRAADNDGIDLQTLIASVLAAHDHPDAAGESRFSLSGPEVPCGENSVSALALLIHEMATNAAKYGALTRPRGRVEIEWEFEDDMLALWWRETSGPPIAEPPASCGFGTTLVKRTVASHFLGSVEQQWQRDGLVCRFLLAPQKVVA